MEDLEARAAGRGEQGSRVIEKAEFKELTPPVSGRSGISLNGRSSEGAAEARRRTSSSSSDPLGRQAMTAKKGGQLQPSSQGPLSVEQGGDGAVGNLSRQHDDEVVLKKKKPQAKQITSTREPPPQGDQLPRRTYRRQQESSRAREETTILRGRSGSHASNHGGDWSHQGDNDKFVGRTFGMGAKKAPAGVMMVPDNQDFSMITQAGERPSFDELGIPLHLKAPDYRDFSMITQAGERPPFDELGIPLHLKAPKDQDFSMVTQAGEKPSYDGLGFPPHLENSRGSRNQDYSIIVQSGDETELLSFTDPRVISSYQNSFNQRAGTNGGYQDQYSMPEVGDAPLYKATRPGKQQQQQQHPGLRRGHTMPIHHDKGQQKIGYWEALEAEEDAHFVTPHESHHHTRSLPRPGAVLESSRYRSSDNQILEMYKRPQKFAESPKPPSFEAPAPRPSLGPRYYEGPGHRAAAAAAAGSAWENQSAMDHNTSGGFNAVQYGMQQNHRRKTSTQWNKSEANPDVVCCTIL